MRLNLIRDDFLVKSMFAKRKDSRLPAFGDHGAKVAASCTILARRLGVWKQMNPGTVRPSRQRFESLKA